MTKQQAIKMLTKRGWGFVRNDGKFLVVLRYPVYSDYPEKEGVFDPRDLLEEVLSADPFGLGPNGECPQCGEVNCRCDKEHYL